MTKNKSYFVKIASDTSFLVRYFTFIITFPDMLKITELDGNFEMSLDRSFVVQMEKLRPRQAK